MHASTVSCTCMVFRCRTARMPCTWLHKVGTLRSSSSCCLCLEKQSMRRQMTPIPYYTWQPWGVTLRWHVTSLQNSSWTHRTGIRCMGCRRTCHSIRNVSPLISVWLTKYVHMLESFNATMQIYMSDIQSASAISCPLGLSSQQTKEGCNVEMFVSHSV